MQNSDHKKTYNIGLLMEQTRLVAADYHQTTGMALPVTAELARFDAIDKLDLQKTEAVEGVDAIDPKSPKYQFLIKGRAIFKNKKSRQKLGKLSLDQPWNALLMVLYNDEYQPTAIYQIERDIIEKELESISVDRRGSMTVAKYKALGELKWSGDQ
ncbi:MAG: hypothetical protein OEY19_10175 [Gammaproteobacteria bacterium]|nr:hypothetical protein [Gammaproteobacteria bacterium]MDH5629805.1 hypothetical protein [Gammaproteobacteria bacterium]